MSQWKWCAVDDNGKVIKGWYQENNNWYYLNDQGVMQTGWVKDLDGRWYYLDTNGTMKTGWIQDKDKWYYLEPNSNGYKGSMYVNGTYLIDKKSYSFDSNGVWIQNNNLVSQECIDFIKSWEGFYPEPYVDCVGVLTLGYGMTGDEIKGLSSVTEPQASEMLKNLINTQYANVIKSDLDDKGVTLTQNEFDSFASFSYNCGTGALLGSTLYRNVVAGVRDPDTITANFQAWSNGGGQRIEGLYRRRTKEAAMFLYADYTGNN